MKKIHLFILLLTFLSWVIGACSGTNASSGTRTLTVYAAASLTDAFTEIGKSFEASHSGVRIVFNFGGSQNLRTQIQQGAPADVFASANIKEMEALVSESLIDTAAPQIFLTNRLVVILPESNPAGVASLEDLETPGLKLILAAEEVPAGRYARRALERLNARYGLDYQDKVLANVVSNEDNIRQVVTKVQLGEADAGIVYVSDAAAVPELATLAIPAEFNVMAEYLVAPLQQSENSALANEFITYVLSPDGQAILQKWGFTPIVP